MTLRSALISVGAFTAVAGVSGGLVGGMLGWLTPGYYHQMLPLHDHVSTIELGIGLGVTEGIMFGVIAGLVVVVAIAWKERRAAGRQAILIDE